MHVGAGLERASERKVSMCGAKIAMRKLGKNGKTRELRVTLKRDFTDTSGTGNILLIVF